MKMEEMNMQTYAFRLKPGQDLKVELDRFAQDRQLEAACVLACVGSLTRAELRFANQPGPSVLEGHFEIVSLEGVLSVHGSHYHIAISDGEGKTWGAHLLEGCRVYTTAEIVIGELPGLRFLRKPCPESGYDELEVKVSE
jgi:uncharacterized protein